MANVDSTTLRICTKCSVAKPMSAFSGSGMNSLRSQCKECIRAKDARRRAVNPRRAAASVRKWQAKNPEKMRAAVSAWQKANPEKARAVVSAWYAKHPEAVRIKSVNRRARKAANGGKLSKGLVGKLLKLQRGKCPCCGKPLGADYHLDHKMPLALGGMNADDNMQLLTAMCNQKKHAKHPVDFMQERGFLL